MRSFWRSLPLIVLLSLASPLLRSDALVVTRAMLASTIAEISIEEDSVLVELEVGIRDIEPFENLLPDELYERLGHEPVPWIERLHQFFARDLAIRPDGGEPVIGRLLSLEPRTRILRDEVTGEALPVSPDSGETVIFARLVYPLAGRPRTVTISPPRGGGQRATANVGFVTYHRGLHINDFRYLSTDETVHLDWNDPWYSKFENRNLRRQFFAPISAFLYVEPYEVRKEIVARPKDLQQWVDLGLAGKDSITVEEQEELKRRVAQFLSSRNPVTIDALPADGILDRVHFIYRNLRTSGVIDPPQDLDVVSATLGVIYVYPTDSLPQTVEMAWELFAERIPQVPSSATDEAGSLPYILSEGDNVLRWRNFLTNPTSLELVDVSAPRSNRGVSMVLTFIAATVFVALLARSVMDMRRRQLARPVVVGLVGSFTVMLMTGWLTFRATLSSDQAEDVVGKLLKNVYRAFDHRDEGRIYDTLERSAAGDLLTDIYLETRRSLELENQGGARAKVKDIEILEGEYTPIDGGRGFESRLVWNVMGSVGHWGHIHQRTNQYEARFIVHAVDGVWKIIELELLEESRL